MMKTCKKCKSEKTLDSFHKEKKLKDGHSWSCKDCANAYFSARAKRPDVAAKKQAYRDANKERTALYKKHYIATKPEVHRMHEAKRRASKINASPDWSSADDIKGFYVLARKLNELTSSNLHVDHIEPLNNPDVCGLHIAQNLQLLDHKINLDKKNKRDYSTPIDRLINAKPHSSYPQSITTG